MHQPTCPVFLMKLTLFLFSACSVYFHDGVSDWKFDTCISLNVNMLTDILYIPTQFLATHLPTIFISK